MPSLYVQAGLSSHSAARKRHTPAKYWKAEASNWEYAGRFVCLCHPSALPYIPFLRNVPKGPHPLLTIPLDGCPANGEVPAVW